MLDLIDCLPGAGPGRGWQTEGRTVHNTPPAPAKYCLLYPKHDKNINSFTSIFLTIYFTNVNLKEIPGN